MHFGQRVSGIFLFLTFRTWKQAVLVLLLALALVGFAGMRNANAQVGINCVNSVTGPSMTIVITNSTPDYNIYPILAAGIASKFDQWMSGCFRDAARLIPNQDPAKNNRYPRASQYRLYVNCCNAGENGIPPGGSATITLPFYSKLISGTLNPTPPLDKNGFPVTPEFIDWWQGGAINVFAAPVTDNAPPPTFQANWRADNFGTNVDGSPVDPSVKPPKPVTPTSNAPTCIGAGAGCVLHFFSTPSSIGNWEPQQLIEYTLGAAGIDAGRKPGDLNSPMFIWDPANVDYDISYVNYAYLPAAILPFGSPLNGTCCEVGWIGTPATIQTTFKAMDDWRAQAFLGMNWPSYVDQSIPIAKRTTPPATIPHKIPSALDIFANRNSFTDNSVYSPAPSNSPPLRRMKTSLWESCDLGVLNALICGRVNATTALIRANYQNYVNVFNRRKVDTTWAGKWGCTDDFVMPAPTEPGPVIEAFLLQKLYGWTPFGPESHCAADANQLADTPGYEPNSPTPYQLIKTNFDELQYWFFFKQTNNYGQWQDSSQQNFGQFDPYVPLIHGKEFMNSPYTYAYSVDDGFGNMQADGTGLIISVGGPKGLTKPENHVTPEVHFNYGLSSTYTGTIYGNGFKISFDSYSRCGAPGVATDPNFLSFIVPQGVNATPNSVTNCQVVFHDDQNRFYTFRIKADPTLFPDKTKYAGQVPAWPTGDQIKTGINPIFIDCSLNPAGSDQMDWCQTIWVYQDKDLSNPHLPPAYHVQLQGPANCDKNPSLCPGLPK